MSDTDAAPATPFHDLDAYLALPRASSLALSPNGERLVTRIAALTPEKDAFVGALWEIDPTGEKPARRLTRSGKGEANPVFAPNGDLLFVSARPDGAAADDAPAALWALPPTGEARRVASAPGGVEAVKVAAESGDLVLSIPVLPAADDLEADGERRKARAKAKVQAVFHSGMPIRFWDAYLGPDQTRLFAAASGDWMAEPAFDDDEPTDTSRDAASEDEPLARTQTILRQLTKAPGRSLDQAAFTVTPDGQAVVTTWSLPDRDGARTTLVRVDATSGEVSPLFDRPDWEASAPQCSPDGRAIAFIAESIATATAPPTVRLAIVPTEGGETRFIEGWDRWPTSVAWLDADRLVATCDEGGRGPIVVVDLSTGAVRRLTRDDGAYTDLQASPDASVVYALRSSYLEPPAPVRVDAATGAVTVLPAPAQDPPLPGWLTEVDARASDGRALRAWLALPDGASADEPAPLAVWIHGGPLSSWNSWSWRWCPWLLVAQGYAVLLPDPALSLGYGQEFVDIGWQKWGEAPFTDVMTLTDAALAREDLDADRMCAMGGSFGGYMANWVAGHTDRFRAIVTHASLWAFDQFTWTTDAPYYWKREFSPEALAANSPHQFVKDIRSPMLVVHGEKDFRVPVSEGIRLFAELAEAFADDDGAMPHRLLYFPDENHWILKPQNAKIWYQTVIAFLGEHVLGHEAAVPDLLA